MCKKIGVAALVVVAALFVLHKVGLDMSLKHWGRQTEKDIRNSVSPEAKLDEARHLLANLGPEERKAQSVIAGEIVAVDKLRNEIATTRGNLDKRKAALADLRTELNKGSSFVTLDNRKIAREDVEAALTQQWDSFKSAKAALESQEDLLKTREEGLEAGKAKLSALRSKREELQAKVDKMEIELKKLRTAQTVHNVNVDDSKFSEAANLVDEIDTQIKTQVEELNLQKGVDAKANVQKALDNQAKINQAKQEMDEFFGNTKVSKTEK
jgi:hypothetical protein